MMFVPVASGGAQFAEIFFAPNQDFNGVVTFNYAAIDDQGQEDTTPATATITVTAENDAPTIALSSGGQLGANIVLDGGFESAPDGVGGVTQVSAGDSTTIPGWTVTAGTVDVVTDSSAFDALEGTRHIDMNGNSLGTISKTLATVAGEAYQVSFLITADPIVANGGQDRTFDVTIDGQTQSFTFTPSGTRAAPGSQVFTIEFVASSNSTTLSFASTFTANTNSGPFLDDVKVRQISAQVQEDVPTILPSLTVADPDAV